MTSVFFTIIALFQYLKHHLEDPRAKETIRRFDAGIASALGTPLITLHDDSLTHALKEVDGAALAVAQEPEQVADILAYVIDGTLNR